MKIIDTHCHLNDDAYTSDLDEVILRAKEAGITHVFNNGDSLPSFSKILSLQERYPSFCFSVLGIHPEFASESDTYFEKAYQFIRDHKDSISAIGEIGLDYHYSKDPVYVENQKRRFIEQIELAKELNLPIVIHSRDADYDTLEIIKQTLPPKLDLHCFSGSYEILRQYLLLPIEVHIGIGGVCTFKNARVIKEVIDNSDISIFLTETDCPYLAPVPYRGNRNEPSYLKNIIEQIATLKDLTIEECATILYENGRKFYDLPRE
jgi:TatD DNase family protein